MRGKAEKHNRGRRWFGSNGRFATSGWRRDGGRRCVRRFVLSVRVLLVLGWQRRVILRVLGVERRSAVVISRGRGRSRPLVLRTAVSSRAAKGCGRGFTHLVPSTLVVAFLIIPSPPPRSSASIVISPVVVAIVVVFSVSVAIPVPSAMSAVRACVSVVVIDLWSRRKSPRRLVPAALRGRE